MNEKEMESKLQKALTLLNVAFDEAVFTEIKTKTDAFPHTVSTYGVLVKCQDGSNFLMNIQKR